MLAPDQHTLRDCFFAFDFDETHILLHSLILCVWGGYLKLFEVALFVFAEVVSSWVLGMLEGIEADFGVHFIMA